MGNNNTITSASTYFNGFYLTANSNYTFDSIKLDHFKTDKGGAIYNVTGILDVKSSTFTNGEAVMGGAIYNTINSTNTITDSIFNNNYSRGHHSSDGGGGAIYNLDSSVISGCSFTSNTAPIGYGGAIYNFADTGKTLSITNSDFTTNSSILGGAIYNRGDSTITGGTYLSNTAFDLGGGTASGGAIYNVSGITTITGATFTTNTATTSGGAIYNESPSVLTINTSTFTGNTSADGGAIYDTPGSTTNITSSTFTSNKATSGDGGAINANGATAIITGGTFTSNTASNNGGAIYNNAPAGNTLSLTNADFTSNSATSGGGIYNSGDSTVTGGTYLSNTATISGGAIYNSSGTSTINNAIFGTGIGTGNTATTSGGAIYNKGILDVTDSTFAHNISKDGGAIFNTNSSTNTVTDSTFISNEATTDGGALYNNDSATISGGSFTSNTATSGKGGAIFNDAGAGKTLSLTNADFTSNSAILGGAIYSSGDSTITGGTYLSNTATSIGASSGGAIYNYSGTAIITDATFTSNVALQTSGGAIYNRGTINVTDSTFESNKSKDGGAIFNTTASTNTITDSTFISNEATNYGGAIYNNDSITISGGSFESNSATKRGGAIYNTKKLTLNADVDFTKNESERGGAIYSTGADLSTINGGTYLENKATISGGAIFNSSGASKMTIADVTFGTSVATGNTATTSGGAIYNAGTLEVTGSTFTGNDAISGGAIYNTGASTNTITDSTFNLNSATDGGAIYNNDSAKISGSSFTDNTATSNGGAIYNKGTLYIEADATTSTFSGNTAGGASNALYNDAGTIYLNTGGIGGTITFNDAITSDANTSAINVNSIAGSPTLTSGTVNFNNAVTNSGINIHNGTVNFGENISLANDKLNISGGTSNFINQDLNTSNPIILSGGVMNLNSGNGGSSYINDTISGTGTININSPVGSNPTDGTVHVDNGITGGATINMYNGIMALANESYLDGNNLGIYGGTLDTQNSLIGTMALNNLIFGGNADWLIDVDLANIIGDNITSTNPATGVGSLNIGGINLLSDANALATAITVADANVKDYITNSVNSVDGALFTYGVSYDGAGSNGVLNFQKTGVSPNAVAGDVAQTQTFLLQSALDRQFFGNIDSFMSFPLASRESSICCALAPNPNDTTTGAACPISGNGTFSPIYSCELNRGIWTKNFVSFENIPLVNGPNVSAIEYGTLIGGDAPLRRLGRHGIVGNTSAYVGYLGSNQNFGRVGISQNGVLVGLAENMVYKNTFLTLMASVGSSLINAYTPYGTDHFSSLFAGAAAKCGHNFEFKEGEYIIQPNFMLAYTFTNTFDYTTASGINMNSDPLNATQIVPGVRLIKNLKEEKGQVYLVANMVFNIIDKTNFTANDVQLPQLSIDPYIEYGLGYQRVWKDRLTGYFQTLLRGGGRNGVALQFGLRWAI